MSAKKGLDRQMVATTGLRLVDELGLEKVSMRALARELNVEAPSLYAHVKNRSDLLDAMIELVYQRVVVEQGGEPWPGRVRLHARQLRRVLLSHPHMVQTMALRPVTGANTYDLVEMALGELAEAGFAPDKALATVNMMVIWVFGAVLSELSADPSIGGYDPDAVAQRRSELDFDRLPLLLAAAFEAADFDAQFEFGLDMLVTGLETAFPKK